ncbi:MAG: pyridoxamine 5'-phosphate oxidase family protein [Lachnospiraceae bacterium]|nr:pyridoxamine 5'-phosphate oxidase family protein [Lachnospiraceae bacterium]
MAVEISRELQEILNDPQSIKVLATTDPEGRPHVVFKGSLHVNEDGYLEYLEFIESSQTNKNMVHSIWFHKTVAINVKHEKQSFQIEAVPYRALIAGKEFEKRYNQVRREKGIDLSTVWLMEPLEIVEETFEKRRLEEEKAHPILKHLDLLVEQEKINEK